VLSSGIVHLPAELFGLVHDSPLDLEIEGQDDEGDGDGGDDQGEGGADLAGQGGIFISHGAAPW
jgi:hypothetical protein